MVLAIYVHLFAALAMAAHLVYLLSVPRGDLRWRPMAFAALEGALLLMPIAVFMVRVGSGYLSWIPPRDFADLPLFIQFLANDNAWLIAAYAIAASAGIGWAAAAWGRSDPRGRAWAAATMITLLVVPVVIGTIVSMVLEPLLLSRYVLYSIIGLALLVGAGVVHAQPRWLGAGLLAAVAVISGWGLVDYYASPKEDWRGAVAYMAEDSTADDAVLVYEGFVDAPLEYYLDRQRAETAPEEVVSVWDGTGSPAPQTMVSDIEANRVWLVLAHNGNGDYTERLRSAIATEFRVVEERAFENVRVVQYERSPL
jgi:mannosyltransferase